MEIYVVQSGDTLFNIARRYGVSLDDVQNLNTLPNPDQLVIGQAIILPAPPPAPLEYTLITGDTLYQLAQTFNTTVTAIAQANNITNPGLIQAGTAITIPGWVQIRYIVRPEDTLYTIAGRFNVPLNPLVKTNQISNPALIFSGQLLNIPQRPAQVAQKPVITMAYFQLENLNGLSRSLTAIAPYISYGAIFQFPVSADGSISVPDNTARAVSILKGFNIQPLMAITNWGPAGFDPGLARTILSDTAVKARVINNLLALLNRFGFAGVNVDFENMYAEDRIVYTDFIRDLAGALKPRGYLVSVSIAPKFSDLPTAVWVGAFDYAAIGELADLIFIMTYEWGWIGGPPMAIAPISLLRRALAYAITQIPPAKIIQGVPFYGYNWPLPHTPEKIAVPVNLVEIYNLAYRFHAVINYDPAAQSPWFRYIDEQGLEHEVWFEDARSIEAKYKANKDFNLRGIGWWSYVNEPYGFPQSWPILGEMFEVIKV
jgi:spore germination protein